MQMTPAIKKEVCIAHSVPDWTSKLFLHEAALTCYSLLNNSVLFLYKVHLGGWSQYETHCKYASLVATTEINWKKTSSWRKVKKNSDEGCIGSYHNFPLSKSNYFVWNIAGICQGILVLPLIHFSLSLNFAYFMKP